MAEIRVIPISKGDLLSSTYHMDAAEFGAYMRLLLIHYDMPEGLPDDEVKLAKWAGCNMKVWKRVRDTVLVKFQRTKDEDGNPKLVQRRTVEELHKIHLKSSSASDNARKRWGSHDADASNQHPIGNATPSPSTKPQPEPEVKSPNSSLKPTPPVDSVDKSAGGGGLDKSNSGGAGEFRISHHLSDTDRDKARRLTDGWDIHRLFQAYDEGINMGHREMPRKPAKAFLAWLPYYTKGKGPG